MITINGKSRTPLQPRRQPYNIQYRNSDPPPHQPPHHHRPNPRTTPRHNRNFLSPLPPLFLRRPQPPVIQRKIVQRAIRNPGQSEREKPFERSDEGGDADGVAEYAEVGLEAGAEGGWGEGEEVEERGCEGWVEGEGGEEGRCAGEVYRHGDGHVSGWRER